MNEVKNASVTVEGDGYIEENMMFTYSEEEMQENEINRENAKLVFSPEFIPFYRDVQEKFQLTSTQTLVYGFIRFYKTRYSGRFYFTDEQLGKVVGCHKDTAQEAISVLKKKGLIECGYKVKAGGGTIRFVKKVLVPVGENTPFPMGGNTPFSMGENTPTNKNKINKNNKYILKDIDKSVSLKGGKKKEGGKARSYGNGDINECVEYLKKRIGGQLDGTEKENRQYCYNLLRKIKKGYPHLDPVQQVKIIIDVALNDKFHSKNTTSFKYLFYNFVKIAKSYNMKKNSGGVAII